MNKTELVNSVSRSLHKVGFQLKKHSPEILLATGIAGGVVSAVMACKASTKVSKILEEAKTSVDRIHEVENNPKYNEQYSEEDAKKDLAITYAQTGLKFVKLYGPSVLLGVASIGCILASNNIIHKRNIALAAAYATVDSSFKEYRGRVIERFGKELDRELKYNIKTKEVEDVVVEEDGTQTVVKRTVSSIDPTDISEYARFFDETCTGWDRDAEYNLTFLIHQQNYANDRLKARGHLYLNEVYDMLGMERTRAGQVVGWIYDPENPDTDSYVDFGIHDLHDENKRLFVNGKEKSILLDFNVDGVIWDLMQ